MNERIDHAAEARDWTDRGVKASTSDAESRCVAMAQVHATLALVEQQRVANLLALDGSETEVHTLGRGVASLALRYNAQTDIDARYPIWQLRPEIAAALGIETGESDE